MKASWLDRNFKWVYTAPAVIFILLMMVYPLLYTANMSFHEWNMSRNSKPEWVGLENYISLLSDERFLGSVWRTFYFTAFALTLEVVLGVAIALLLFRDFRGKNVVKTLFLLPMVATPVAMGLVWKLIYEPSIGAANVVLEFFGFKPLAWLASPTQVIPALVIVDVWQWTPMIALIVMAGMSTLPEEPYEAAELDGAKGWQKIVHLTLPLLKPTIIVATMLRLIDVLKTFDIIYATTTGGPDNASETLNIYGYILSFQYFKMGSASALIMMFTLLIVALTFLMVLLRRRVGS